jgi:hypothetical protein
MTTRRRRGAKELWRLLKVSARAAAKLFDVAVNFYGCAVLAPVIALVWVWEAAQEGGAAWLVLIPMLVVPLALGWAAFYSLRLSWREFLAARPRFVRRSAGKTARALPGD